MPIRKRLGYAVTVIVWKDAVADTGWETADGVEPAHTCISIGYVIKETDTYIVLAGTLAEYADGMQTNNRITIPKGWITERKKVNV